MASGFACPANGTPLACVVASLGPISSLSVPRDARTVVLFGGSFDPPHYYHTIGPLSVVGRVLGPKAWMVYVPAARSPLKASGPVASDEDRLAMLRLALDLPGRRSIWTDELDRARRARGRILPSYTIDTIRRARRVLPSSVTLRLLIGSDQAAAFHRWRDFRAIIRLAEPIVMAREPIVAMHSLWSALGEGPWTREEKLAWCARIAPNFPMPASSTSLRERIARAPRKAEAWERRQGLDSVTTAVAEYIIEHRLYGHPGPARGHMRGIAQREADALIKLSVEERARRFLEKALAATSMASGTGLRD